MEIEVKGRRIDGKRKNGRIDEQLGKRKTD